MSTRIDNRSQIARQLLFAAASLMTVGFVGASGYRLLGAGRWSYTDCLYMTLITLSTVGYGEILPGMAQVAWVRLWTVLLIVLGSGSLLYFISSLTAFIVEGDITGALRRRRMQQEIDALNNHVIVVGVGTTGIHVAKELYETKVPFVVIDSSEQRLTSISETIPGLLFVHGDATLDHVLERAGIARAAGLAATLPEDKDNVFVTISARALNASLRIVSKLIVDSAESKLKRAGANAIVSPSLIGGMRLVSELVRPSIVQFLDTMLHARSQNLRVEEVVVPSTSTLIGARLGDTTLRVHSKVLLLAAHKADGSYAYNPNEDFVVRAGTKLLVLGEVDDILALRRGLLDGSIGLRAP